VFEDRFDGCEVVPSTMESDYRRLEEEPLAAPEASKQRGFVVL
jgi:hypothetical protein